MNTPWTQYQILCDAVVTFRAQGMGVHELSRLAREQTLLLQALPPRYSEVLSGLLDRLESSALFSEESCSFSQRDLLDSLNLWLDKARGQLPPDR